MMNFCLSVCNFTALYSNLAIFQTYIPCLETYLKITNRICIVFKFKYNISSEETTPFTNQNLTSILEEMDMDKGWQAVCRRGSIKFFILSS